MRFKTAAVTAAFTALCTTFTPSAVAEPPTSRAAAAPGQVCFWTKPGMMGQGWCYGPPGYAEAENGTQRNAYSFESRANSSVYAISYGPGAGCVYREIRKDDYDENWTAWATRLDGVSHEKLGCEPG
ncbi:hypothetical protein ACFWY6_07620 [Streptomyces sp. NPDC059037]|uniref:hypothetical protein n=1 Tax=Streptomyces sp. NPDC059037 TaxID=3346710 RepID=UPI00369D9945